MTCCTGGTTSCDVFSPRDRPSRDSCGQAAGTSRQARRRRRDHQGRCGVKDLKGEEGFNAQTEQYENLVTARVIDPAKVVRSALQNAASIASLLLTTEAVISQTPDVDKGAAMPGAGMGGGMY
jgi:hypothetical protein